jgi:hypothetical protein
MHRCDAKRRGHFDQFRHVVGVATVHGHRQGDREAELDEPARAREHAFVTAFATDRVVVAMGAVEADLEVDPIARHRCEVGLDSGK